MMKGQREAADDPERLQGARLTLWLIMLLLGAFGVWASVGRIEVVSQATGAVVPFSRVKVIQHLEGGIVDVIHVAEGQTVKAGQSLITLAPTRDRIDVEALQASILGHKIDLARIQAELAGGGVSPRYPVVTDKPGRALIRRSRELIDERRNRLKTSLATHRHLIEGRRREAEEIGARLKQAKRSLKLLTEQIGISKKLLRSELSNRMEHLGLLKEQAGLVSRRDEDEAALAQRKAAVEEAQGRLKLIESEFREEARREYDKAARELELLQQKLRRSRDSLDRTVLRSPSAGIVKSVAVTASGAVIKPGEPVLEIVPVEDRLVVEAQLPIEYIGFLQIGQTAQIRLASGSGQRFGALDGKVAYVSPDSHVNKDGLSFYRIRIETEKSAFEKDGLSYRLYPGVQVACSIISGERTVLSYLIDPLLALPSAAMREL